MGDAHAAHFEAGGLGEEGPEGFPGFFDGHAMQVEAAFKADLAELELAHLAFLDAVTAPVQVVFGADINDKLV
ncbi:hypothetical protein D3C85_1758870 [compost metagenome]